MTVFGIDVSDFQAPLDTMVSKVKAQGFGFLIAKCTEGSTFVASSYAHFQAAAKANGMLFGSYHFLHHGDAAGQAKNYADHCIDKSIPVMIDLEADGATIADALAFRAAVKKLGVVSCTLYIPHWYWSGHIGSPNLSGWRVVSSQYPTTKPGFASALYANGGGDHGGGWSAYGGATPEEWQFSDSTTITGYSGRVDGDAFRGTLPELKKAHLFKDYGHKKRKPKPVPPPTTTGEVYFYNLREGRAQTQVEAEIRAILSEKPIALGVVEAVGYRLPKVPGFLLVRDRSTESRANVALYVNKDFGLKRFHWHDRKTTWKRTGHPGMHPARSDLDAILGNKWRLIVAHGVPYGPKIPKENSDAGQAEELAALTKELSPSARHRFISRRPLILVEDANATGRDAKARPHGPGVLAETISATLIDSSHIDTGVARNVKVVSHDYPTHVAGVQLKSDHKHALRVTVEE